MSTTVQDSVEPHVPADLYSPRPARRMSQAFGSLAKTKDSEATRLKYKGTDSVVGIVVVYVGTFGWWALTRSVSVLVGAIRGFLGRFAAARDVLGVPHSLGPSLRESSGSEVPSVESTDSDNDSSTSRDLCTPSPSLPIERSATNASEMITRAELLAYEEEHRDAVTELEFRIRLKVQFGQSVCLVGSVRELGNWEATDSAVNLKWTDGDVWTTTVAVKRADVPRIEYKYLVRSPDSSVRWESGGNHNVLRPPAAEMVQVDTWEFPGYNCSVPANASV